ncbi:protein translocase subunit, partial [Tulasnella sp. 417]
MYARAQMIRCAAREASSRPLSSHLASPSAFRPSRATRASAFHSSSSRRDDIPRSPYQIFVETLKEELRKNKDLQDNVKQLQGDVDKFQDSESMKRAKEMYERARLTSSIKENPKLRAAAE